jgi:hypothetical protein
VALLEDAEYADLTTRKATMPKTRFGDAYEPRHLASINRLSQENMT